MGIKADDIKIDYIPISEARRMSGLRIVLGAFAVPGPWHEACTGVFYVKGLDYTPVRSSNQGASDLQIGMDGSQSELVAWTAQSSAPVVVWNDERPRSLWNDQSTVPGRAPATRAVSHPRTRRRPRSHVRSRQRTHGRRRALVQQATFHGRTATARIIAGRQRRPSTVLFLGRKYGYTPQALAGATRRVVEILDMFDAQLALQRATGRRYLIGDQLSALDIYWATSCGFLDPMPEDRCPMYTEFRSPLLYGTPNAEIGSALTKELRAHRDFIYEAHLQLPIVF